MGAPRGTRAAHVRSSPAGRLRRTKMAEHTNRTFICSVLFLDIVEYSQRSVAEQIALKERFNAVLTEAIAGVATDDRIILDTGDGAAVSFLGDPEDTLFAGMHVREHEVYAISSAPSNLRRTVPVPAPRPTLRIPKLHIPKFLKLRPKTWPDTLAVNGKLLVAAPLAFTLIVGTGVIARGHRNSDGESKTVVSVAPPAAAPQAGPAQVEAPEPALPQAREPKGPLQGREPT